MIKAHLLVVDSDPLSPGMLAAQACPNPEATLFGISELLVNGVEHGNPGLSYDEKSHQITLGISDEGQGFALRNYLELDPRRACVPKGRGIALARMLSFSSIHDEGCGNVAVATIAPLNCQ